MNHSHAIYGDDPEVASGRVFHEHDDDDHSHAPDGKASYGPAEPPGGAEHHVAARLALAAVQSAKIASDTADERANRAVETANVLRRELADRRLELDEIEDAAGCMDHAEPHRLDAGR